MRPSLLKQVDRHNKLYKLKRALETPQKPINNKVFWFLLLLFIFSFLLGVILGGRF